MKPFRIYPEFGSLYFEVYVFENLKEMKKHAINFKEWYPEGASGLEDAGALTIPFTAYKGKKIAPLLGHILFSKKPRFDHVVAAHECSHAAVFYAIRAGLSPEKIFYGESAEEKYPTKPLKPSKKVHQESLKYQHERYMMLQTYMLEQIIEKANLNQ